MAPGSALTDKRHAVLAAQLVGNYHHTQQIAEMLDIDRRAMPLALIDLQSRSVLKCQHFSTGFGTAPFFRLIHVNLYEEMVGTLRYADAKIRLGDGVGQTW